VITPESYKLMSNHLHGCKLSRDFAMDGEYTAITFTSIFNLRTQCDPRARRGIPKGGRRQPPFGCHRQRDKTSNRGFNPFSQNHVKITAQANSYTLKARGKLPPTARPTILKAALFARASSAPTS
jgi:hypothetical protein